MDRRDRREVQRHRKRTREELPSAYRVGYTFRGWWTQLGTAGNDESWGTEVTFDNGSFPAGTTTVYYAKWTADAAHINFVDNQFPDNSETWNGVTDQTLLNAGYTRRTQARTCRIPVRWMVLRPEGRDHRVRHAREVLRGRRDLLRQVVGQDGHHQDQRQRRHHSHHRGQHHGPHLDRRDRHLHRCSRIRVARGYRNAQARLHLQWLVDGRHGRNPGDQRHRDGRRRQVRLGRERHP